MSHHGKSAERKWVYNPQYNSAMLLWIAWKHEKDPTKMSQLTRKYEWSSDFVDFSVCLMIWRKVGSMLIVFSLFSYVKISTSIPTSNLDHNSHQNSTIPSAFLLKWCKYFMANGDSDISADSLLPKIFTSLTSLEVSKIPHQHAPVAKRLQHPWWAPWIEFTWGPSIPSGIPSDVMVIFCWWLKSHSQPPFGCIKP